MILLAATIHSCHVPNKTYFHSPNHPKTVAPITPATAQPIPEAPRPAPRTTLLPPGLYRLRQKSSPVVPMRPYENRAEAQSLGRALSEPLVHLLLAALRAAASFPDGVLDAKACRRSQEPLQAQDSRHRVDLRVPVFSLHGAAVTSWSSLFLGSSIRLRSKWAAKAEPKAHSGLCSGAVPRLPLQRRSCEPCCRCRRPPRQGRSPLFLGPRNGASTVLASSSVVWSEASKANRLSCVGSLKILV